MHINSMVNNKKTSNNYLFNKNSIEKILYITFYL